MSGIYLIKNMVNEKKYIGQTKRSLTRRWTEHKSDLNRGVHKNPYLQHAWDKYGSNNFVFEIIHECEKTQLKDLEKYYIEKYNSMYNNNGYNICPASDAPNSGKMIIAYNLITNIKQTYKTRTEASKELNIDYRSIGYLFAGKIYHIQNFIFYYADESQDIIDKRIVSGQRKVLNRIVKIIMKNTGEEKIFCTSAEAARYLNIPRSRVSKILNGTLKTDHGYEIVKVESNI